MVKSGKTERITNFHYNFENKFSHFYQIVDGELGTLVMVNVHLTNLIDFFLKRRLIILIIKRQI